MDGQQNQYNITDASPHLTTGLLHLDLYSDLKTSSLKAAISMIMEKPENEILLLQKFYHVFIVIALYLNKVSLNASINK